LYGNNMTDYRHDIEKYLKGELTTAERNALERKALEGAEQLPSDDFVNDIAALNEKIVSKKSVSVWSWSARIAAGLIILLVSSYIIWTVVNPEPVQDLAFEKSEPEVIASTPTDSVNPIPETLSTPSAEQPSAGPSVRDKDVATRSTYPSKADAKPTQEIAGEPVLKNEPADEVVVSESKTEGAKAEEIPVTEPVAIAKSIEKEEAVSRAKAFDDTEERKSAKKKSAAPAVAADKSDVSGLASSVSQNVIRGQVTSAEDGSALSGVNVIIKGSSIGTVTDSQGNYEIEVNNLNPTLQYAFIGLKSTEVSPEDRKEVNVKMAVDVAQLSEVVVTGYRGGGKPISLTVDLAHPEGGNRAYKQYLERNMHYPQEAKVNKIEGRVTIEFMVESDGTLSNFNILNGIGYGCDEELIRLVKEGPKWLPTKYNNVSVQDKAKVRLKFEMPK
jgi:TonB family protein